MKWVIFLMAALGSQMAMADGNPKTSYDSIKLLGGISSELEVAANYYLRTFSGPGTKDGQPVNCTLLVSPRNAVPLSKSTDSSVDIFLLINNQILSSVNLKKKISNFADQYQQLEITADPAQPEKLKLAISTGHFTDQVNGAHDYVWSFTKTSERGFSVDLEYGWADDDGFTGGADYTCQF